MSAKIINLAWAKAEREYKQFQHTMYTQHGYVIRDHEVTAINSSTGAQQLRNRLKEYIIKVDRKLIRDARRED